jgi:hypothetical protein
MTRILFVLSVIGISLAAGCRRPEPAKPGDAMVPKSAREAGADTEIGKSLAKLSPEDRKLAQAQKFCAVQGKKSRLGSMGTPVNIMLKGQPVFLCCDACIDRAQADPDGTLARAEKVKE